MVSNGMDPSNFDRSILASQSQRCFDVDQTPGDLEHRRGCGARRLGRASVSNSLQLGLGFHNLSQILHGVSCGCSMLQKIAIECDLTVKFLATLFHKLGFWLRGADGAHANLGAPVCRQPPSPSQQRL
jgi:hypothetical protein